MLLVAYERLEDQEEESAPTVTKHARLDHSSAAKKRLSLLWKFCEEPMDENSESET